jgi:hypothetical protein
MREWPSIVPGVPEDYHIVINHMHARIMMLTALNIGRPKPAWRKHAKVYRLLTWKPIGDTSNG